MRKPIVLVLVMLLVASSALARTIELNAVKDNGLWGENGVGTDASGSNRGSGGRMNIDRKDLGNGLLVQFDLAGVLNPGEEILSATIEFYCGKSGSVVNMDIVAYPLADAWQEGTGTTGGVVGSTGYPWGDAAAGDTCFDYQAIGSTTAGSGGGWVNYQVADHSKSDHTAWNTPGGRGIGTDVDNVKMVDVADLSVAFTYGLGMGTLDFTAAGVDRLQDWADGVEDNNGMNFWATDAANNWEYRAAQRELYPAVLTLVTPEPATLAVLGVGGVLTLVRRRRK